MKQPILQRVHEDAIQTTGELNCSDVTDGNFFCDTLELPNLNNQPDVSRIPAGIYPCQWTFSPRHKEFTYEIMNVPNRTGIRIDIANFAQKELLGCVAVGNDYLPEGSNGVIEILHSRITWDAFNAYFNKEDFQLTIIDVPQETKMAA